MYNVYVYIYIFRKMLSDKVAIYIYALSEYLHDQ